MSKKHCADKLYLICKLGELHYEYMQKWYDSENFSTDDWLDYVNNNYTPKEQELYKQIQESEASN